jgi:hypothetical protein
MIKAAKEGVMGRKTSKGLWVGAAIATLAFMTASGHTADISCKVPFTFSVSGKTLPPGAYAISTPDGGVLIVRGVTQGALALTNSLPSREQTDAKMAFHRYADQYFLREVWIGGGANRELPRPRQEGKLKAANIDFDRVEIPVL